MISPKFLDFSEFREFITSAERRWELRSLELSELLSASVINIAGFGGKGASMARQLRAEFGLDVHVYDASHERLQAARNEGFDILNHAHEVRASAAPVILAACQFQMAQRELFPRNHVFFQEAAFFFDLPQVADPASKFRSRTSECVVELYDVYCRLHELSRTTFLSVLGFRASGDPVYLSEARAPVDEMWLDLPTRFKRRSYNSVLDVGAYDGDTLASFHEKFNLSRALAVEANLELLPSIQKIGKLFPLGIKVMPMAAWSRTATLSFDEVRFGMVRVFEANDGSLPAKALDEFFDEPFDLLKMDIEGSEMPALLGAERLIKSYQPDLAIAAYHRPDDLIEIPGLLSKFGYDNGEFLWHVGHYSDCLDDTIFYATLKNRDK